MVWHKTEASNALRRRKCTYTCVEHCRKLTMFHLFVFATDSVVGLEKANRRIRDRAKLLQEKSDSDDRLVDALRKEIQVMDKTRPCHSFNLISILCTQTEQRTVGAHEYIYLWPCLRVGRCTCNCSRASTLRAVRTGGGSLAYVCRRDVPLKG